MMRRLGSHWHPTTLSIWQCATNSLGSCQCRVVLFTSCDGEDGARVRLFFSVGQSYGGVGEMRSELRAPGSVGVGRRSMSDMSEVEVRPGFVDEADVGSSRRDYCTQAAHKDSLTRTAPPLDRPVWSVVAMVVARPDGRQVVSWGEEGG